MWYVYLIECENRSLYTGITDNLERRFQEHKIGKGAKYTRIYRPLKLVYFEEHKDKGSALSRESQIKKWTKQKKLALINKDFELLKKL
ncbi:MAG: GIY-YIG nuclease family protein [Elusimicrobia bacterium]|nr:GIY-YIG nuclease family protein [Elusimicrobiota bacterium]